MSEYLIVAENITYKNNKLSCINVYDRFTAVALPAEFTFDLVIICGPEWSVGEHQLLVKARANNGVECEVGKLLVNVPNEDFVYNAYAHDLKVAMDYSITDLTFFVYDGDREIIKRKYPVVPMFVPQKQNEQPQQNQQIENGEQQENQEHHDENNGEYHGE